MEILLWLLPSVVVTGVAMLVAGWVGRERTTSERQEEQARERFAKAMQKPQPSAPVRPQRTRSTGVAVRVHAPAEPREGDAARRRSA